MEDSEPSGGGNVLSSLPNLDKLPVKGVFGKIGNLIKSLLP